MKVITIGRSSNNDVVINDSIVGRNHCQITQDDRGNFRLIDLNSKNGTFVNGRRVSGEVSLRPNDVVVIGMTTLPWRSYFTYVSPNPESVQRPIQPQPQPFIQIPNNININRRNENINADVYKKGDDFQVPFKRNVGNAVGNTVGCIISVILIAVAVLVFGLCIKGCA